MGGRHVNMTARAGTGNDVPLRLVRLPPYLDSGGLVSSGLLDVHLPYE